MARGYYLPLAAVICIALMLFCMLLRHNETPEQLHANIDAERHMANGPTILYNLDVGSDRVKRESAAASDVPKQTINVAFNSDMNNLNGNSRNITTKVS